MTIHYNDLKKEGFRLSKDTNGELQLTKGKNETDAAPDLDPDNETRAAILKNRLLEERIEATRAATAQRKQKTADERDAIAAEATADIDRERDERLAAISETFHGIVTRFFIVGTAAVFAFAGFWIAAFAAVIVIGIFLSLINAI